VTRAPFLLFPWKFLVLCCVLTLLCLSALWMPTECTPWSAFPGGSSCGHWALGSVLKVYYCRSLALAFMELIVAQRFHEFTHGPGVPPSLRAVLERLSALYALWSLNQHVAVLYRGEACGPGRPFCREWVPTLPGWLC
jgi:hypothetical protein